MKIPCKVHGKSALVVGYAQNAKGREPFAIVITKGRLKAVRLKDIDLGELPGELGVSGAVVPLRKKS